MPEKAQFAEDLEFRSSIKAFLPSYHRRNSKWKQNRAFRKPCECIVSQGERLCEIGSQALRIQFASLAKPVRRPCEVIRRPCELISQGLRSGFLRYLAFRRPGEISQTLRASPGSAPKIFSFPFCSFLSLFLLSFSQ